LFCFAAAPFIPVPSIPGVARVPVKNHGESSDGTWEVGMLYSDALSHSDSIDPVFAMQASFVLLHNAIYPAVSNASDAVLRRVFAVVEHLPEVLFP
jgi:hypothetical protein